MAPVQLIGGGQLYCNVDSVSGQVVISNLSPLDANDVIYDIQAAGGLFQIAYDTISLLAGSASDTINIGPLPTLGFNGVLPITTIVSYLLDGNQANDTLTGFVILSNIDIITNAVDAACFGDNSFITATVVGGYGPTNLAWNDGSINDTIVGAAGAYFVTAVDSVGCLVTVNDTINEPAQLIASAVDNGNGTASASSTGGTAPVTFLWSNGDTSATATAATSGVYTVTITDANGCTDTANVNITITGQIELLASGQLTVYPNPTRADLTLDFNLANQSDVTVRIFNANGQLINERILSDMQSDNFVMDVQKYPSGLYMLNVLIDNQSYSLRFVKE